MRLQGQLADTAGRSVRHPGWRFAARREQKRCLTSPAKTQSHGFRGAERQPESAYSMNCCPNRAGEAYVWSPPIRRPYVCRRGWKIRPNSASRPTAAASLMCLARALGLFATTSKLMLKTVIGRFDDAERALLVQLLPHLGQRRSVDHGSWFSGGLAV